MWILHKATNYVEITLKKHITPLVTSIYFSVEYHVLILDDYHLFFQFPDFPVSRLLTDFVCILIYEFWISLWKIALCMAILLLPLFTFLHMRINWNFTFLQIQKGLLCTISAYHHWSFEFESRLWRGILDTTLCDKVYQ